MTKNLTDGEPARLILMFTLPLIAGNIFQQLYAFVDTLIVGRFLGVDALAAVGCTGSLMFLMLGFVIGFSTGITIYTGQRYGAKDDRGVRQSAAACTILSIIVSVVLTIIGVAMCRQLLIWMQTPPEILEACHNFIDIGLWRNALFFCLKLDFLSMLIRSGQKEHIIPGQALETGQRIRDCCTVRMSNMKLGTWIIDRCCYIKWFLVH